MKIKAKYILVITLIVFNAAIMLSAGQFPVWDVPEEVSSVENAVESTKKSIENGRAHYNLLCASCHGTIGDGNGVQLSANLISDEVQAQTDGALYYKIRQGRDLMPGFSTLPETQIWEVVHYLRSLVSSKEEIIKKPAKIELKLIDQDSMRIIQAVAFSISEDGSKIPLADVKLDIIVLRMFGNLNLNNGPVYTDEQGMVSAVFPDDLPADTAGFVVVGAQLDNPEWEAEMVSQKIDWGAEWEYIDITKKRSLWAVGKLAPWWVLVSFLGAIGAAWLLIVFVMLELKKINKAGKAS